MSPTSSEPPEGTSPSKPRPPARAPVDSSEMDLWDFDDDPSPAPSPPPPRAQPTASNLPPQRATAPAPRQTTRNVESISAKRKPLPKSGNQGFDLKKTNTKDDMGELEEWAQAAPPEPVPDESSIIPEVKPEATAPTAKKRPQSLPKEKKKEEFTPPTNEPVPASEVAEDEPESSFEKELQEELAAEAIAGPTDEPVPGDPEPEISDDLAAEDEISPRPGTTAPLDVQALKEKLKFTKLEKIGLAALTLVLVVSAIVLTVMGRNRLNIEDTSKTKVHYPIKGALGVTVNNAKSFWREPISGQDAVRRGTALIPVVELELEGGSGAIRAFFKDEKGATIGDPVTRKIENGHLEISATAGLEDIAVHAAYRTGETAPWTLEVFEGPSVDSPRQDFKPLLVTPISNDRN